MKFVKPCEGHERTIRNRVVLVLVVCSEEEKEEVMSEAGGRATVH